MMDYLPAELLLLIPLAFTAGLIDSAVGGGGLIQIPGLFSILPQQPAATLLGTNKMSSMLGTAMACRQYAKRVSLRWRMLLWAAGTALICSYIGASFVKLLPIHLLRPIMLVLLILMVAYTILKKDLGQSHKPITHNEVLYAIILGIVMGLYDGFFGPGMGSLLAFAFVRFFGHDFLNATAHSKIVNLATNIGALALFIPHGDILWITGLLMGVSNMLGSLAGTHVVAKYGAPFIRKVFIIILSATIVKFSYDTFKILYNSGAI
ncbi:MAG: sulfite exporter TauE/SafE family protein [Formosimonas sp.]